MMAYLVFDVLISEVIRDLCNPLMAELNVPFVEAVELVYHTIAINHTS